MSNSSRSWGDSFERRPARHRGGRFQYDHDRDTETTLNQSQKRAARGARKAEPAEDNNMNNNDNLIDRAAEAAHNAAAEAAGTAEEILQATGRVVDDLAEQAAEAARQEEARAERLRQDNDRLEEAEARDNARTGGWMGGLKKAAGYGAVIGLAGLAAYHVVKLAARATAGEAAAEAAGDAVQAAFMGR